MADKVYTIDLIHKDDTNRQHRETFHSNKYSKILLIKMTQIDNTDKLFTQTNTVKSC